LQLQKLALVQRAPLLPLEPQIVQASMRLAVLRVPPQQQGPLVLQALLQVLAPLPQLSLLMSPMQISLLALAWLLVRLSQVPPI
jgi:hypothetical protein